MAQVLTETFPEVDFSLINESREYSNEDIELVGTERMAGYFTVPTADQKRESQTFYVSHTPVAGSDRVRIVFSPWSEDPKRAMDQVRNDAEVAATGIATIRVSNPGTHPTLNPFKAYKTRVTDLQRWDIYGRLDDNLGNTLVDTAATQRSAVNAAIESWYDIPADSYFKDKEVIGSGSSLGGLLLAASLDAFDYDTVIFHNTVNIGQEMSKKRFLRKIARAAADGAARYAAENEQAGLDVVDDMPWRLATTAVPLAGVYLQAMARSPLANDLNAARLHEKQDLRVVLVHGDDVVSSPAGNEHVAEFIAGKGLKVANVTRIGAEHTEPNSVVRYAETIRHAVETADRL